MRDLHACGSPRVRAQSPLRHLDSVEELSVETFVDRGDLLGGQWVVDPDVFLDDDVASSGEVVSYPPLGGSLAAEVAVHPSLVRGRLRRARPEV